MKLVIALSVAALLTVACSSGGEATGTESEAAGSGGGGAGTVAVEDFAFKPETTEVATGEQVEWTVVEGASPHTVKFEDEESKQLAAGESYSRSFDKAGQYDYVCGIHPQMTGTVAVK